MILREGILLADRKKKLMIYVVNVFLQKKENAENALREYLQERGGEKTPYVTEYMPRGSYLWNDENVCSRLKRKEELTQ